MWCAVFLLSDKMQVVIAEYNAAVGAEVAQEAQRLERAGAAINEVAYTPQLIFARFKLDVL